MCSVALFVADFICLFHSSHSRPFTLLVSKLLLCQVHRLPLPPPELMRELTHLRSHTHSYSLNTDKHSCTHSCTRVYTEETHRQNGMKCKAHPPTHTHKPTYPEGKCVYWLFCHVAIETMLDVDPMGNTLLVRAISGNGTWGVCASHIRHVQVCWMWHNVHVSCKWASLTSLHPVIRVGFRVKLHRLHCLISD